MWLPKPGDKVLIEFEVDRVVAEHLGFDGGPALRVWKGGVEFWIWPDWIEPRESVIPESEQKP